MASERKRTTGPQLLLYLRRPHPSTVATLALVAVTGLTLLASSFLQPAVSYNGGRGWDGVEYYRMAEEIRSGQPIVAVAPEVYRIGTPWLAAHAPQSDLLDAFWAVNVIGGLIAVGLLAYYLRICLGSQSVAVLLTCLFILQWHAPVRFVYFYPAYVDPLAIAFVLAALIASKKLGPNPSTYGLAAFGAIAFIAALFRDLTVCVPLAFTATRLLQRGISLPERLRLTLPMIAGALGLLLAASLVSPNGSYSFPETALQFAYSKSLVSYLHAWFIAFGPILVVVLFQMRVALSYLRTNRQECLVLVLFALVALFGGTDTERLLYFAMPVVYVLIGHAILARPRALGMVPFAACLAIAQAVSERLFWTIPNFPSSSPHSIPLLTPIGSSGQYLDLYSFLGLPRVEAASFAEYLVLVAALFAWWRYLQRPHDRDNSSFRIPQETPTRLNA